MIKLESWIEELEHLTDLLFISGLGNVPETLLQDLKRKMIEAEELGLEQGFRFLALFVQGIQSERLSHDKQENLAASHFFMLQSYLDAVRAVSNQEHLKEYYQLEE